MIRSCRCRRCCCRWTGSSCVGCSRAWRCDVNPEPLRAAQEDCRAETEVGCWCQPFPRSDTDSVWRRIGRWPNFAGGMLTSIVPHVVVFIFTSVVPSVWGSPFCPTVFSPTPSPFLAFLPAASLPPPHSSLLPVSPIPYPFPGVLFHKNCEILHYCRWALYIYWNTKNGLGLYVFKSHGYTCLRGSVV